MRFPTGPLGDYFRSAEAPAFLRDPVRMEELAQATRCLAIPCRETTVFARGQLDVSATRTIRLHTIFSRRDRDNVPYTVADLAADLSRGQVHRPTISEEVEQSIRHLARLVPAVPANPEPVIVEDESSGEYLILEGNKRLVAFALTGESACVIPACVGRSSLVWERLLALYNMRAG